VGFLAFYENEVQRQLYVTLVCVDGRHQRIGIGRKMFAMLEAERVKGFTTIGLEVDKVNTKGYNFYKKQGFTIEEDRGSKYLMVKSLPKI